MRGTRFKIVLFLEDLHPVVSEVYDDEVPVGGDADARRPVHLARARALHAERADEHALRSEHLETKGGSISTAVPRDGKWLSAKGI